MRRGIATLLALVLTACIGIGVRIPPKGGGPVSVQVGAAVGPVGIAVAVGEIRTKLARVRNEIAARRTRLSPVDCGSAKCYAAGDVQAAVAEIRREVNAAFPDAALASRLTLDAEIAQEAEQLAVRRASSDVVLIRYPPAAMPAPVAQSAVDAIFGRIRARIDKYLSHEVLNPTITVKSEPAGATFAMKIGDNLKTQCQTLTDNEIQSVWRGRYNASAHKPGYRDVSSFMVDLVNDDRTNVRCSLVPLSAPPYEESNCRLEQ